MYFLDRKLHTLFFLLLFVISLCIFCFFSFDIVYSQTCRSTCGQGDCCYTDYTATRPKLDSYDDNCSFQNLRYKNGQGDYNISISKKGTLKIYYFNRSAGSNVKLNSNIQEFKLEQNGILNEKIMGRVDPGYIFSIHYLSYSNMSCRTCTPYGNNAYLYAVGWTTPVEINGRKMCGKNLRAHDGGTFGYWDVTDYLNVINSRGDLILSVQCWGDYPEHCADYDFDDALVVVALQADPPSGYCYGKAVLNSSWANISGTSQDIKSGDLIYFVDYGNSLNVDPWYTCGGFNNASYYPSFGNVLYGFSNCFWSGSGYTIYRSYTIPSSNPGYIDLSSQLFFSPLNQWLNCPGSARVNFNCMLVGINYSKTFYVGQPGIFNMVNSIYNHNNPVNVCVTSGDYRDIGWSSQCVNIFPGDGGVVSVNVNPPDSITEVKNVVLSLTTTAKSGGNSCYANFSVVVRPSKSWWQSYNGDVLSRVNIFSILPSSERLFKFTTGNSSGIPFYKYNISLGSGDVSDTNRKVKADVVDISYNYQYFYSKVPSEVKSNWIEHNGQAAPVFASDTNWFRSGNCYSYKNYRWCYIKGNFEVGYINQNINFDDDKIVVLVEGNTKVNANFLFNQGRGLFMLVSKGDITLSTKVTDLYGVFISDNNFNTSDENVKYDDAKLNVFGTVIAYQNVNLLRYLPHETAYSIPAEVFTYLPSNLLKIPVYFNSRNYNWREVNP